MPRDHGPSLTVIALTLVGVVAGVVALVVGVGALVSWLNPAPTGASTRLPRADSVAAVADTSTPTGSGDATTSATAPMSLPPAPSSTIATKPVSLAASRNRHKPTIPERMASIPKGSAQMIVATGAKPGSTLGTLYVFEVRGGRWVETLKVPCRFGTNGLANGATRVAGNRTTPTGIWRMPDFVFGQHPAAPAGTKMPYRHITSDVYWSDERDSTFNQWVRSSRAVSGEHLIGVTIQYEYALSTGYNAPPNEVVPGRGAAIFLHVFDPPDFHNGLSAGCVAVSRDDIVRVFRLLDPVKHPTFAVGTEGGGPTGITAQ
jgi:L,D-peptidoglycan transpeptidase YkuD (ErfK/YbiS/YcfS/YnhG family)